MACLGTHWLMDGPAGLLPDAPLIAAVLTTGAIHPRRSPLYQLHLLTHHRALIMLLLAPSRPARAWGRHVLLDHLTHQRGWYGSRSRW